MTEKNKKGTIIVLGLLLIGVIAMGGCVDEKPADGGTSPPQGDGDTSSTAPAHATPTTQAPSPTTQPGTTPTITPAEGGISLSDLLSKGKSADSYKYDMVITVPGEQKMTQKVWMKKTNMRTEMTMEGQTMITIMNMNKQEMYMYYPEQKMAMKMDFTDVPKSATEEVGSIENYNPTIVGTETIDGKLCTVVGYNQPDGNAKMWIWQERGFPIQVEGETAEGTMKMEWKNIEFGDIPDSMFELPNGVEIMDMPSMPQM